MEWLDGIWGTIAPYIYMGVTFLASTGIFTIIGQSIFKKWNAKINDANLAGNIASQVSSSIVSKPIRVSLENANKKNFKSLEGKIENKLEKYLGQIGSQNSLMIAMSKIMLKFKNATEEEKEELKNALNSLEKANDITITEIEKEEPVIVSIEPVSTRDDLF